MKDKPLTEHEIEELKMLYSFLPEGKNNTISRYDLATLWNASERSVRTIFAKMIRAHLPVCNIRNGYFRPATKVELQAYANIINSYKKKFETKDYHLNQMIKLWDNLKMTV